MTSKPDSELFSGDYPSNFYADFRPDYSSDVYDAIFKFANLPEHGVAVDIATGTGQAVPPLAKQFKHVIALDRSQAQVKHAVQLPNVEYRVGDAHATGLPDHSADLVTTAQAMHWFELPAFFREVRRILRPGGTFATWTYDAGYINSAGSPADQVFQTFYESLPWSPRRKLVDQKYVGLEPTQDQFGETSRVEFRMDTVMAIEPHFMGYLRSWSAVETYLQEHPGSDPLAQFKHDFMAALSSQDDTAKVTVVRTLTLLMARQPVPVG